MVYFSQEILIHHQWCQKVPLSHWFAVSGGQDNLLGWRELFASLFELKSCIWFWDQYICFEWVYSVFRFDQFWSYFARTFQEQWQIKGCWEILIFEIFFLWHPFMQNTWHIFSYIYLRYQYLNNQSTCGHFTLYWLLTLP